MKSKITLVFFLILAQLSFGQYGVLDNTFHGSGQNGTEFAGNSTARSITFQSNGKILFAGNADDAVTYGDKLVGFVRVNDDGNYDTTFGNSGTLRMRVKNASFTNFASMNKIDESTFYLLSYYGSNFSLTKLNADCIVDTSFGTNGTFDFSYGYTFTPSNLKVESDGSFTASGAAKLTSLGSPGIAIGKYHANATVDTTFGTNGFLFLSLADIPSTNYSGIAYPLNDGKYLVVGNYVFTDASNTQRRNLFLKKFNANGTVDTTYGTNGVTLTNAISASFLSKVAADGSVTIDGNPTTTYLNSPPTAVRTVQFDANGFFVNQPSVYFNSTLPNTYIYSVLRQDDGKLVMAGQYMEYVPLDGTDSFVSRFLPDGTSDSTFGTNGVFKASFGGNENISKITLAPDQKLVFSGTRIYNGHWEYLMGRLTSGITLGSIPFTSGQSVITYPNPVQATTFLQYELTENQTITIDLYDLNGKLVKEFLQNSQRSTGHHKETLNLEGYEKGTYIIKMTNGSNSEYNTKIILE